MQRFDFKNHIIAVISQPDSQQEAYNNFSSLSGIRVGFTGNLSMALRHYVTSVNMKKLAASEN